MGAVDFLRKKRAETKRAKMPEITAIAPSISERHGIGNNMGSYNTQSGQYTGNGPDGIVQPQLPTQRRMDGNGNPYVVDEGELLVIDAQTLKDYGGAEALDSFIQQNRQKPGQMYQMNCGGKVPHQKYLGGPVGAGRIQEANGVRQYSTGGVPTRPRMFGSPQQLKMLDEVRNGIDRYQEGGTVDKQTIDQISKTSPTPTPGGNKNRIIPGQITGNNPNRMFGGNTPKMPNLGGNITNPNPIQIPRPQIEPPDIPTPVINPINITPSHTPMDPITPQITPIDLGIATPLNPVNITPTHTPMDPITPQLQQPQIDPAQVQPEVPPQPGGDPTYSPSNYDEMMLNRYLTRQGAMSESERAAEAQRGLQAGLSEREVMGRGAISDVSRRAAMGDTTAQFAMDAAKREDERDRFQQGMSFQERQMESADEQFMQSLGLNKEQLQWARERFGKEFGLQEKQMQMNLEKFGYSKKMDAVSMLIGQGGAENLQKASDIMSGMFGNSVDFSNALQAENLGKFNAGFNNMMSSVAAGMSFEDWLKTAEADGTFESMNMTESDLETIYNKTKLQSDPLYQTISMVDNWVESGLIDKDQADDLKAIMAHQITNPGEFGLEVSDGYEITDENGNLINFFKSEDEANKFLQDNKDKGYNSNFVKDHVGPKTDIPSGDTVTPDGTTLKQQFDDFMMNHAPDEQGDTIKYEDWIKAGKPKTWKDYQDATTEGLTEFTETLQGKYEKEGWPSYTLNYYEKLNKKLKKQIDKAREDFLVGENIHSKKISDIESFENVSELIKEDYINVGNIIVLDGHSSPYVISSIVPVPGAPEEASISLVDMITGKIVRIENTIDGPKIKI